MQPANKNNIPMRDLRSWIEMCEDFESFDNKIISQYPIIQRLGMVPAVLITDSKFGGVEKSIAKAPWDAVVITDPVSDDRFYNDFIFFARQCLIKNINDKIETSKKNLPIISPNTPSSEWQLDMPEVRNLQSVVESVFQKGGVVFVTGVPDHTCLLTLFAACMSVGIRPGLVYLIGDNITKPDILTRCCYLMCSKAAKCIGEYYSESEVYDGSSSHIYVNQNLQEVDKKDIDKIALFGELLTVENLDSDILLSERGVPYAFRSFLNKSVGGRPDWYCYNSRMGFHLKREIEKELLTSLENALKAADINPEARPLLLCGQAYSGKTNILCSIAYQIFSQKEYPVIYIPYVGEIRDSKNYVDNLNFLLRRIEYGSSDKIVPTLIVWDISCRQTKDLDVAWFILNSLRKQGRQVQMLCSSYTLMGGNKKEYERKYECKDVPASLSNCEQESLKTLLKEKGGFVDNEIDNVFKKFATNPHFLASLYKYHELHDSMAQSIDCEVKARNVDLEERLKTITQGCFAENLNNSLAVLLESVKIADDNTEADDGTEENESRNKMKERLKNVIHCIALCTFYGGAMPISLVLRLLKDSEIAFEQNRIYQALLNHSLLRDQGDDEDFEMVVRSPLEAEFILRKQDRLARLEDIINNVNIKDSKEIVLIRKLIQSMGPNCRLMDRNRYSLWNTDWRKFKNIWEILSKKRDGLKEEWQIELLPQELSLMREYSKAADDKNIAAEAYKIVSGVLDNIDNGIVTVRENLKANIYVEYCLLAKDQESVCDVYTKISSSMEKLAFSEQLSDLRLVRQTLLNLGFSYYEKLDNVLTPERIGLLGRLYYWCSEFMYDADEQLENKIGVIYEKIDTLVISDDLVQELLDKNNTTGIYVKSMQMKRNIYTLPKGSTKANKKNEAERVLNYLKKWGEVIEKDPLCMYLLIEMYWMSKTGLEIIPEEERNTVDLGVADWEEIKKLCQAYGANAKNNSRWEIDYLRAVALLHCEEWDTADNCFRELRNKVNRKCKCKQYYVICDNSAHTPRVFERGIIRDAAKRGRYYLKVEKGPKDVLCYNNQANDFGYSNFRDGLLVVHNFIITVSYLGLEARPCK